MEEKTERDDGKLLSRHHQETQITTLHIWIFSCILFSKGELCFNGIIFVIYVAIVVFLQHDLETVDIRKSESMLINLVLELEQNGNG